VLRSIAAVKKSLGFKVSPSGRCLTIYILVKVGFPFAFVLAARLVFKIGFAYGKRNGKGQKH
jgi:hypothetical protein